MCLTPYLFDMRLKFVYDSYSFFGISVFFPCILYSRFVLPFRVKNLRKTEIKKTPVITATTLETALEIKLMPGRLMPGKQSDNAA